MEKLDLSTIYTLENKPHSIRFPQRIMDLMIEDANKHGRKIGTHFTAVLVDYLNNKDKK